MFRKIALLALPCVLTVSAFSQTATTFPNPQSFTLTPSNATWYGNLGGGGKYDAVSFNSLALEVYLAGSSTPVNYTLSPSCNTENGDVYFNVADANGDGVNDIVLNCPNEVDVFVNNGSGTFSRMVLSAADAFSTFTVGDLNKDGKPDLAYVAQYGPHAGDVAVVINNGDGGYSPIYESVLGSVGGLAIADINGDGYPDLLASGYGLTYWLNQGGTSLAQPKFLPGPLTPIESGVIPTGDVNGDGITDVILVGEGQIYVVPGSKSGVLSISQTIPAGSDQYDCSLADLNGDGHPDLFCGGTPTFGILLNDGKGNFTAPLNYLSQGYGGSLLDLNNDGHPDVLFYGGNADYVVYNNGDGSFAAPNGTPDLLIYTLAADFNGDGLLDVAGLRFDMQSLTDQLYISTSNGDGTFRTVPVASYSVNGYPSVFVADVNKDGKPDLVFTTAYGLADGSQQVQVQVCLNQKASTLAFGCGPVTTILHQASLYIDYTTAVVDVDGDGIPDILMLNQLSASYYAKGLGNGTFAAASSLGFTAQSTSPLFAADLHKTGRPSLIINSVVYDRNADGTYTSSEQFDGGVPLAVGDVNGDGYPDVIVRGEYGAELYLNQAGSGFSETALPGPSTSQAPYPYSYAAVIGDFDGDGVPDLAVLYEFPIYSNEQLWTLHNDGAGNFTEIDLSNEANYSSTLVAGHLNGAAKSSKKLDLLMGNSYNEVALLNQGNTQPAQRRVPRVSLSMSPNPVSAGSNATLVATVTAASGTGNPTGTVTFWNDTTPVATANVVNGKATAGAPTTGIPQGSYSLIARYSGDATFQPLDSNLVLGAVKQSGIPTQTYAGTSALAVAPGGSATIFADVRPTAGTAIPTGNVQFNVFADGGSSPVLTASAPLNNGRALLTGTIPSNANGTLFTFTANYQGGGGFAASNSANHDDDDSIESNTPPKVTITSVAGTPSGIQISGNTSSSLYLGSPQLALLINNKPEPCYPLIQPEQGSGSNYTFTITLSDPALTAGTYTFVVVSKGQLYEYPTSYSAPYTVTLPL